MRVGFVGLGVMGRPMARNVLRGGHELTVYDTSPRAIDELVSAGATAASDYRELAAASQMVITMLPKPADVESAVLGTEGLASALAPGSTFVDMSTGDPATARKLAEKLESHGIDVIDCPVGRGHEQAEAGTLLLLAGGRDEVVERVRSVLMCMGDEIAMCGPHGAGQAMKLVNNMLGLVILQGIAEAVGLGLRAGLPLELIKDVTSKTSAQSWLMDVGVADQAFKDLTPGFALRLAHKDLALAKAFAEQMDVPLPAGDATLQCCADLIEAGHGGDDCAVVVAAAGPDWASNGSRAG